MDDVATVAVCGLPSSGKTTFLAALWHVVESGEIPTQLAWSGHKFPQYEYVNELRKVWLEGREQQRTQGGVAPMVGIDLEDARKRHVQLLFPDHSGETYSSLWRDRECSHEAVEQLQKRRGLLLFANADRMAEAKPLGAINATAKKVDGAARGLRQDAQNGGIEDVVPWSPDLSPDQVRLTDIVQALKRPPLESTSRRVAILLSAWDAVAKLRLSPFDFLRKRLPLLEQSLHQEIVAGDVKIYGLSAQGRKYAPFDRSEPMAAALKTFVGQEKPSQRVRLVDGIAETSDLTAPLAWIMS